ncbi:MAG: helix-turn-helix transcriptional regulator [Bdellovibrionaceae bacterium]|nr:helix-turn-helix transcriptional regulator [Bdellovibrionales bacterium]MCB9085739.1 helix-turn-helix transcriptional regulator [Pseudobdellovibrionaceae bacterium]
MNRGTFLVLMALLDGAKHGYEISKYIEERSRGFFRMPFGTLYPILHRLEKEGNVKVKIDDFSGAKSKKVYTLTSSGKKLAKEEVSEFDLLSKAIKWMVPV